MSFRTDNHRKGLPFCRTDGGGPGTCRRPRRFDSQGGRRRVRPGQSGDRDLEGATISARAGAPSGSGKRWRVIVPAAVAGLRGRS